MHRRARLGEQDDGAREGPGWEAYKLAYGDAEEDWIALLPKWGL